MLSQQDADLSARAFSCCAECAAGAPDFGSAELFSNGQPHAVLTRFREAAAVHRLASAAVGDEFWGVFRAEEAKVVLGDDDVFLSGQGVFPWNGPANPDPLRGSILIATDGDHRSVVRSAMKDLFTKRRVETRTTALTEALERLVRPRIDAAAFDFNAEIAWPLALASMADLLGLDEPQMSEIGDQVAGILGDTGSEAFTGTDRESARQALAKAAGLFSDLMVGQRNAGQNNLIGHLHRAERAGRISRKDVLSNLIGVVVGGTVAPRLAFTGLAVLLAREPSWLSRLAAAPELVSGFVDEALRWTAPTTTIGRTAGRDVELGGRLIRRGDTVRVVLGAVLRDPRCYRDPDAFDPLRREGTSMAFGFGPHHCLGAVVAKSQLTALLEFFVENRLRVVLSGQPTTTRSNTFTGYRSVPVRLLRDGPGPASR
ncbi:cytochrome P450 [Lentzea sp. CC55]|uniref:cytochrome P450 n=1 Tax=Lentzea sp. CC55 TaxID=2884909 RepID=UPI001F2296AE|nr:cytochrome P450 [Lentzea sp. CC55]MCG8928070.1 cytochrome P450 [Lentzea sp. CC55]